MGITLRNKKPFKKNYRNYKNRRIKEKINCRNIMKNK
jgi:hypothetical protein